MKVPEEVEVHLSAAQDVLPMLVAQIEAGTREKFDFVFVDADWDNQWRYFDWGVRLSNGSGSAIYVDNAVQVILDSGIIGPRGKDNSIVPLLEKVAADGRVEVVTMQTVGKKAYDGFLMTVVR
jgi:predicted O-methyltransferase YrrM